MPVLSMTGFGQSRIESSFGELNVELKSVNNRYCEINVRMPREFIALELDVRDRLKKKLLRGKIDCSIKWAATDDVSRQVVLDHALINSYREQIQALQQQWNVQQDLPWRELLALPGAVSVEQMELDIDAVKEKLLEAIDAAIEPMTANRSREGASLSAAIIEQVANLETWTNEIDEIRGDVVEHYRERLNKRLEDLMQKQSDAIDESRLEAEVLIFAERCDIEEEIVRLRAHLQAFRDKLKSDDIETGKGLEFLTQELLRETNTIGSKARQTKVNAEVVEMKKAIDKIKEQTMNIL